ncbi:hypothetical protein M3Y94_01157400 [Aphelenchoides besseyi]|nr:hypothetical protein M3Y94_01157400 [Aphelenchoides besseyi]KAI6228030.1 hypothetical protein M3Y95_00579400 [Aphelenchoides besseyi]
MGATTQMLNKLLIYFVSVIILSGSTVYGRNTMETDLDAQASLAKPCKAAFECWRSEPVDFNGIPLALAHSMSKRLDVGQGFSFSKGGKCRCRSGECRIYIMSRKADTQFYPCQEF